MGFKFISVSFGLNFVLVYLTMKTTILSGMHFQNMQLPSLDGVAAFGKSSFDPDNLKDF